MRAQRAYNDEAYKIDAFPNIPEISTEPKNHIFWSWLPQPEPVLEEIPKVRQGRKQNSH
jgi:hypothetical protein